MALLPCPACALLRAPEDIIATPCPVCGHRMGDAVLTAEEPDVFLRPAEVKLERVAADSANLETRSWGNRIVVFLIVASGLGVLAGMVATEPAIVGPPVETPVAVKPPTLIAAIPTPPPATRPMELAPMPRRYETVAAVVVPELAPMPRTRENILILRVDRPKEDYHLDRVGEGNQIKLVGKVKRFLLDGVEAGATVDASELEAHDVHVAGPIVGGATVRLRARDGTISFRDAISSGSQVTIDAGNGLVVFPSAPIKVKGKSVIGGGARVTMTGKTIMVTGPVDGDDTLLDVTLTKNGSIRFVSLDGTSKLLYRLANPTDPLPRIASGQVRGKAECRQVQ